MIDLRSDTVTKPTKGMLEAMMNAKVGDDVFGEDPTVIALEDKAAAMFGKEAGIFCPSGTMTNQIAIKLHTQPGDEVICDATAHIYNFESGGLGFNSGIQAKLINGERGRMKAQQVEEVINH
jgi:threonine aldolase